MYVRYLEEVLQYVSECLGGVGRLRPGVAGGHTLNTLQTEQSHFGAVVMETRLQEVHEGQE